MWCSHLIDLIFFNFFFRYKQARQVVKSLIEADNIATAQTQIGQIITEHDNYVETKNIDVSNPEATFTALDNHALHHAELHLEHAAFEPNQKQATINALDE